MEGKSQAIMNVTQVKDEIRYLSLSDKIEIYRWLDGELTTVPFRIGSCRSIAIRQEIERTGTLLDGRANGPTNGKGVGVRTAR